MPLLLVSMLSVPVSAKAVGLAVLCANTVHEKFIMRDERKMAQNVKALIIHDQIHRTQACFHSKVTGQQASTRLRALPMSHKQGKHSRQYTKRQKG